MALTVDIEKKLGDFHLSVSLETDHEVLALLGASGCGKSVTLQCIAGIETPDRGRIVLNGRTLFDSEKRINLAPQKRRVGYLFQQYALFPDMTVEQNILTGLRSKPKAERRALLEQKLRAFRLDGLEKRRPSQLSGGQQQRVALARILASEPEVLLLDEPFSALDSYLKWQVELELLDTLRDFGGDVLFVSHSRDEVCRMCRSVCVLSHGRSEGKQAVERLMDAPETVSAALLSGCKNYSRIERVDAHHARCLDWGVTLETSREIAPDIAYVGIRAHSLRGPEQSGRNLIPCRVERVINDAFSVIFMLSTPGGAAGRSLLRAEYPKEDRPDFRASDEISLSVRPEHVLPLAGGGL